MYQEAAFSCFVSTVGLILPFILTDPPLASTIPAALLSNAQSATVVWINQNGHRRTLTLSNALSATFTYTVSMGDTRSPHIEQGYLQVAFDGQTAFMTSSFVFNVVPHF